MGAGRPHAILLHAIYYFCSIFPIGTAFLFQNRLFIWNGQWLQEYDVWKQNILNTLLPWPAAQERARRQAFRGNDFAGKSLPSS
jgi:hypothetical protein